jgi:uncharacterized OsmC-like protein
MSSTGDDGHREVQLRRLRKARFVATNARGGTLELGEGDDDAFTPVELLLAAIAGCTAIDVDYITAKRAEADSLEVQASGVKVRDEAGNRLEDLVVRLAAGRVLPSAVQRSHDRICTVARTVIVGTPVDMGVVGQDPE